MFTTKKPTQSKAGVASKILGAVALGASAAVVGLKAVDRVRKSMRAKMRAALNPRYSKEDHEAVARMEGEGGPSRPLPNPRPSSAV